ncbi:AraC family transcriptional regulator [Brenneria alni]|uniref:Arabinose operon regulatory protein n=1 Tax=Brenneria alni TaxID=71656 RepID=A0A421DU17_9GAMM|nr:helix-turn-helix transcriptional regulator [Brenneria alni]RLM28246.1 AraC family transcriptional regulator [Brenneria alni]
MKALGFNFDGERPTDLDDIPRTVVTSRFVWGGQRWEAPKSQHRKSVLIYVAQGVLHCEVGRDVWIVPPQRALWLPRGVMHSAYAFGKLESYVVWVDGDGQTHLPATSCITSVSHLLRELLLKAATFPVLYAAGGPEERLLSVIIDELVIPPWENLCLPIPKDPRLRRLVDRIITNPSDKRSAAEWSACIGLGERTMSRLFLQDIGMSFGRWKRQLHITLALQRLASGDSVQTVAFDLGYESSSSFITMFRKTFGKSPGRYLSEWKSRG